MRYLRNIASVSAGWENNAMEDMKWYNARSLFDCWEVVMKRKNRALLTGVALIIVNQEGAVLLVRELEAKPHLGKYVGIFSIPMETIEEGENEREALVRLIAEELGGFPVEVEKTPRGVYWVTPHARASLYAGRALTASLPTGPQRLGEVDGYRWVPPQEALQLWVRRVVCEMLADYIGGRSGVTRRRCRPVASKN